MSFSLCSDITIGPFKKVKPHEVKVNKSVFEFVDKAVIKVPITARVKRAGEVITASAETAKVIEEGMAVSISLGYNGILKNEFTGFVKRLNLTTPCEIECEGYSYQLRKQTPPNKTFVKAQLLDILQYLVSGTDIVLDIVNMPKFIIEKLVLSGQDGCEALEMVKKISQDTIRFYFTGKLLTAGLVALPIKATTKYRLGWNVIKDSQLKLREAKNQNVVINIISEKKDGTKQKIASGKHTGTAGTTGETKVFRTHAITDEDTLTQVADAKLQQLKYSGYEGKITAFLVPYCEPGYKANLEDKRYTERGGNYLTVSTEVTYTMSGGRRIVGIGIKL